MSTLKVNAIEPYSGGTVTITGASIDSASYAETANTLTAGDKTIEGMLSINGTSTLDPIISATGSSYLNGNVYVSQGNVDIATGQFLGRRASLSNRVRVEDGTDESTVRLSSLNIENNGNYGIVFANRSEVNQSSSIDILSEAFPGAGFLAPFQQIVFQRGDNYTDGTITMINPVTFRGDVLISGSSTVDPVLQITGSSYLNGNVYVNQGNVDINTGQFFGRRLEVTNRIRLEDGVNYKNTLSQQRLSLEKESGYYGIELSNESQVDGSSSIDILTPAFPGATFGVPNQQIVFQRGDAYTDGTITMKNPVTFDNVIQLEAQDPLPTGALGQLAVSGSDLYFHNGTAWQLK